jgi:hypothetical protein
MNSWHDLYTNHLRTAITVMQFFFPLDGSIISHPKRLVFQRPTYLPASLLKALPTIVAPFRKIRRHTRCHPLRRTRLPSFPRHRKWRSEQMSHKLKQYRSPWFQRSMQSPSERARVPEIGLSSSDVPKCNLRPWQMMSCVRPPEGTLPLALGLMDHLDQGKGC